MGVCVHVYFVPDCHILGWNRCDKSCFALGPLGPGRVCSLNRIPNYVHEPIWTKINLTMKNKLISESILPILYTRVGVAGENSKNPYSESELLLLPANQIERSRAINLDIMAQQLQSIQIGVPPIIRVKTYRLFHHSSN